MSVARRYIITGAASGIGRSVAEKAAAEGAALFLVDINAPGLAELQTSLQGQAASVGIFTGDLQLPEVPQQIIDAATADMGGIDVLVSNAGYAISAALEDLSIETFDTMMAVNARATWLLAKAAYPCLVESRGNIVATASTCGHQPAPPMAAYSASKAALLMLVRQMALEWGPVGIRSNSVSPGPTITGLSRDLFDDNAGEEQRKRRAEREAAIPLRKVGEADEVANAIMFLASPGASQITGVDIIVDGGLAVSLMPAVGVGKGA